MTPYIPRFETVKVLLDNYSDFNLYSLALPAIYFTINVIYYKPFKFIFLIVGVVKRLSVYSADDIFKLFYSFLE